MSSINNCQTLVHELGRNQPKTTKLLLFIATWHASGEEAVETIFEQNSRKAAEGCPPRQPTRARKGAPKATRGGGAKQWPQRVTVTTSCDVGDHDKDVGDSDEELIATAERDFKRQARLPTNNFVKLLEATCPNHTYPVRHKLNECTMMKNYMTTGTFAKGKKLEGDSMGKVAAPFPEEKAVMSIYSGLATHKSWRKLKLTGWAINVVCQTILEYLRRSESPITFDQMDHPGSIPKLGRFALKVNPPVGMTRLTKALMDGGSGLNLMYLDTFEGLGLTHDTFEGLLTKAVHIHSTEWSRATNLSPSGGSLCRSPSEM
jgi:hypothetical protein